MNIDKKQKPATGKVLRAFGNLLHVQFEGNVRQGELAFIWVERVPLKAEVIEIAGTEVKIQVFEDTRGIQYGTRVEFLGDLLEVELGPGLLGAVFDGLQNPLSEIAKISGIFLKRGVYLPPLNRNTHFHFEPSATIGISVSRGMRLGTVREGRFLHKIMVPFSLSGNYKVRWIAEDGSYRVDEQVALLVSDEGEEISVTMLQKWPIKIPLLSGKKLRPDKVLTTGWRIIDTQLPIVKGGTFCTPGPFGAGKTVLQHHLSKYASVDIVVIVACGERAGEVVEILRTFPTLTDPHTRESLMSRTIIICNTSSMPVASREASVYTGVTIAEYYRQMGLDVLLLADSTSRWAQAMREISGRLEEIPGEEAFPAYLSSRIAAFYERAGVISMTDGTRGSLTIGGTVSPAGGNFEEPVTQATLLVVGAFHGLSRARSDARRFPAIDPLLSWTKYLPTVQKTLQTRVSDWETHVRLAMKILQRGDEIGRRMEVVGEEGISIEDFIVYLQSELYDFAYLQQNAFSTEDVYCCMEKQIDLFSIIQEIFSHRYSFSSHDAARKFFLNLQSDVRDLHYVAFPSDQYREGKKRIEDKLLASDSLTSAANI